MKQILPLIISAATLFSCGNSAQNKAIEDQKEAQKVIEAFAPERIPAKEGGWTMTAKIDGKPWTASSLRSSVINEGIVGFNKDESIHFPNVGVLRPHKIKLGEYHIVNLFTDDEIGWWSGRNGEIEITKVANDWVEGQFFFTAASVKTNKTIEVTDGFFRVSLSEK